MNPDAGGWGSGFVIDADPEGLLTATGQLMAMSEHLATGATSLGKIPGDIGEAWQGHTAIAIKTEMTALAGLTTRFPAHFTHAAKALTGFAQALSGAQIQVARLNRAQNAAVQDHAQAVRRAERFHDLAAHRPDVSPGEIEDAAGVLDRARGRADADRDHDQDRLTGEYEALITGLGAHARRVGRELASATVVPVPDRSISTWLGRAGAPCMRGDLTAEQAAMEALEGSLPLLHRREAQDAAKDVQGLLPAAVRGDVEALRRLREQDQRWATDPYFAHALAAGLGPDGLTEVAIQMQTAMRGGEGSRLSASDASRLAKYLGSVIAVASNPAYDKALDEASRAEYASWREQEWFPGWIKAGNAGGTDSYLALTQFLEGGASGHVQPGAAFMGTVGADILRWDKATWTTQNADQLGRPWAARMSLLGGFPSPVRSLLQAAKGDRPAEQALLLADVGGESAMRYLVKDRHLGSGAGLLDPPDMAFGTRIVEPDYDALLGDMAIHADMDRTDQVGTRLASEFAGAYIDGIYESKPQDAAESSFGVHHAALRPALALVLGYHVQDVAQALTGVEDQLPQGWRGGAWGMGFSDKHRLAATFADLAFDHPEDLGKDPSALAKEGRTPPALSLLLRQVIGQTGSSLTQLAGIPQDRDKIAQTASDGVSTLRYILDSAQAGLMGSAEAQDAANEELAQLWSQGIGLIPLDKIGPAAGVADMAVSMATDSVLEDLLPTDHAARRTITDAQTDTVLDGLMGRQIQTALAGAGAWDADKPPAQWLDRQDLPDPQAARFIDESGAILPIVRMTVLQLNTYRQFLHEDSVISGALRESRQSASASTASAQNDYLTYGAQ